MSRFQHFWFIAQTSAIFHTEPEAPTNFYVYKLDLAHLGKVKLAVENAEIGTAGLVYPAEFLAWLDRNDRA